MSLRKYYRKVKAKLCTSRPIRLYLLSLEKFFHYKKSISQFNFDTFTKRKIDKPSYTNSYFFSVQSIAFFHPNFGVNCRVVRSISTGVSRMSALHHEPAAFSIRLMVGPFVCIMCIRCIHRSSIVGCIYRRHLYVIVIKGSGTRTDCW